jgi:signal transduction histidine kinase
MTDDYFQIRILAVDDNPVDRALLRRHLAKIPDWEIDLVEAANSEEALSRVADSEFDIVILDHYLGSVDGLRVLQEIHECRPDLPVILATAGGDEHLAARALRAEAADYLPKQDIKASSLKRSIENAVEKGRIRRSLASHQQHLERTVNELNAKNEEVMNLYHSLAHELKTPLTGAREFISIVRDGLAGEVTEEQSEYLATALSNCDRLVRCINDMLDSCRADAGKLSIHPGRHAVADLIGQVLPAWSSRFAQKDIVLETGFDAELPMVLVDEDRFHQILSNLLSNAIKFTPRGGTIAVRAMHDERRAGGVAVSVADTGRGIDPNKVGRVFDRLYQVTDGDAAVHGGLGLGLNICRELVRLHGGEISVDSKPGEGSVFTFTLPTTKSLTALAG